MSRGNKETVTQSVSTNKGKEKFILNDEITMTTPEVVCNVICVCLFLITTLTMYKNYTETGSVFLWTCALLPSLKRWDLIAAVGLILNSVVYQLIALTLEKRLLEKTISDKSALKIVISTLAIVLVIPVTVMRAMEMHILLRGAVTLSSCFTVMKLVSYYQINKELRTSYKARAVSLLYAHSTVESHNSTSSKHLLATKRQDNSKEYPGNLTIGNVLYWAYLPTFCYKINFPTKKFRPLGLLKELLVAFVFNEVITNIGNHIISPLMQNFHEEHGLFFQNGEHVLGHLYSTLWITFPMTIVGYLGGYACIFQTMKIIRELLCYDCEVFCGEFWRATDIKEYWKTWNLPVHNWFQHHVLNALRKRGWNVYSCVFMVFLISGLIHDYALLAVTDVNTYFAATIAYLTSLVYMFWTNMIKHYGSKYVSNMMALLLWPSCVMAGFSYKYKRNYPFA